MSTALVLSNNRLLVNLDYNLQVKDFYFPFIGQENQLNQYKNKMFFQIDGELLEINGDNCQIDLDYVEYACIAKMNLVVKKYGIEINFTDLVMHERDIYIRNFTVYNKSADFHDVRVYFQNNFALNESVFADTAVWYQPAGCLLHYSKDIYLGIGSSKNIYQFTCAGKSDYMGKGAYPLASGELPYNPVATGDVSSCLAYKFSLEPGSNSQADYFIAASQNLSAIESLVKFMRSFDFDYISQQTSSYWRKRLTPILDRAEFIKEKLVLSAGKDLGQQMFTMYWKSVMILLTQIDESGAVIAANDGQFLKNGGTDSYSYFWPRDGANAIMALTDAGLQDEARKVLAYSLNLSGNKGFFWHKYFPNAKASRINIGSSWHPWVNSEGNMQLPIQEDATALMLLALVKYYLRFSDKAFVIKHWHEIEAMLKFLKSYNLKLPDEFDSIKDYITGFSFKTSNQNHLLTPSVLPKPSFDIWEQYYGVFTYTAISILESLKAGVVLTDLVNAKFLQEDLIVYAKELGKTILSDLFNHELGCFVKGIRIATDTNEVIVDSSADASLLFAATLTSDPAISPMLIANFAQLKEKLLLRNDIGGWARKEDDHYLLVNKSFPGNPWALTMLWSAQNNIKLLEFVNAYHDIAWVLNHADKTGLIAEQFNPETGYGLGMKPLTWSHAEYIKTINLLINKLATV